MYTNRHGRRWCRIVLTGSPCSGKTSAQRQLQTALERRFGGEWTVYVVHEASSLLFSAGIVQKDLNERQTCALYADLLRTIRQLEGVYDNIARDESRHNVLVLCDRGALDPKAFVESALWPKVLDLAETTEQELLDRYHAVVCLPTAPRELHALTTTRRRRDSYDRAYNMQERFERLYQKHRNLKVLKREDCPDWDTKFEHVAAAVVECLATQE